MNTEDKIEKVLIGNNINFKATLTHERTKMHPSDTNRMDRWYITLNDENFDFYTGLGHRVNPENRARSTFKKTKFVTGRSKYGKTQLVPVPTAASVLYCLLSDANVDESFEYWCDNYGYDSDSISALKIYDQCKVTKSKIDAVFSGNLQSELLELLQDY